MADCKDHGQDESPWMCECTMAKLARLESDNASLRCKVKDLERQIDRLEEAAVDEM